MNKAKFNLMDGFIIILVLLVVLAGTLFLTRKGDISPSGNQTQTAIYTVEIAKCEKITADAFLLALENGEAVSAGEKERFLATLTDVKFTPAKLPTMDEYSGKMVLAEDPILYDVTLTLQSTVTETNSDIVASSSPIKVGQSLAVRSKSAAGFGYITNLELAK